MFIFVTEPQIVGEFICCAQNSTKEDMIMTQRKTIGRLRADLFNKLNFFMNILIFGSHGTKGNKL